MEYQYNLGDMVVLLDGKCMRHEGDVSWNAAMDNCVGRTGEVVELFERCERPTYRVAFDKHEMWYAEEDWLQSAACRYEESERVNSFIDGW